MSQRVSKKAATKRGRSSVKKYVTRERVLKVLQVLSDLLGFVVLKRPALLPFKALLGTVIQPSEVAGTVDTTNLRSFILQEIKDSKSQLANVAGEEQQRIQVRIDTLVDLLVRF